MASPSAWPPALKTYVNETFAKCTEINKKAVESELKELIFKAFAEDKLWTTDWPSVKLKSLAQKKRKTTILAAPDTALEHDRRDKRAKRFVPQPHLSDRFRDSPSYSTPEPDQIRDPNVIDWDNQTVVGTSTRIEKPFLRLTTLPDPTTIRPLPVLEKTLELLKRKWREESNYNYICDQFKSMRQDLTVQRIKNEFTCTVYEIHARIALEKGDLPEFNQCQGQLRELYKHGLPGHVMEFLGYRILYLLFARNRAELNSTLAALTQEETQDPSVVHAIAVRQALSQGNYSKFFRLFCAAPKMGAYLMDHFVPRERVQALVTMTKAYQQLPLTLITSQLAFDTVAEAHSFLTEHAVAFYKPFDANSVESRLLECKLAHPGLVESLKKFNKVDLKFQV